MLHYGFSNTIVSLISSFRSHGIHSVELNNQLSSYQPVLVGTPQGTKLGPILWLLYCNDLNIKGCSEVQYADDTIVYKAIKTTNNTDIGEAIEQAYVVD